MPDKITAPIVFAMKQRKEKIVTITAYDAPFAKLAEAAGADIILVGDSLGNVLLGYDDTLSVTLEDMIHHTRAAARGVSRALLVADLPFGSYQAGVPQAVESAVALVRAGAGAVKLEGMYVDEAKAIIKAGIPVMGHLGMTPQSVLNFGGHKVQGRGGAGDQVVKNAQALAAAGMFAMVLELIPPNLAKDVTAKSSCPTIGIGAGPHCDGQVQVLHDVLGLSETTYRHAKPYMYAREEVLKALTRYTDEVRKGEFPTLDNAFEDRP